MMIMMRFTESLIKNIFVLLCVPQNAPECSSKHLTLPKFPEGACPQTSPPSRMNSCMQGTHVPYRGWWHCPPTWKNVMYGPGISRKTIRYGQLHTPRMSQNNLKLFGDETRWIQAEFLHQISSSLSEPHKYSLHIQIHKRLSISAQLCGV